MWVTRMRIRRRSWFQRMSPRALWLFCFAGFFTFAFTYITLHDAGSLPVVGMFPRAVLRWLEPPRAVSDDGNVLHKDFEFVIKVLAYNRVESLRRCLRSLAVADYGGDTVHLNVLVDHFQINSSIPVSRTRKLAEQVENEDGLLDVVDEPEVEIDEIELSNDPVERNLQQAHQMLGFLDKFQWSHGTKQIHYRTQNLGLQGQWLEAWWPTSDHQFALIVEDDMELSPLFYRYVRSIIANYYYDPANFDPSIFGITLQRPRFVSGKDGDRIMLENSTRLFLYQMVGSWGQVLFPKPWKEFLLWFDAHKAKGLQPLLEGMVSTGWYRKLGDKIWTPWFIKFVHARGYFNIHTNFLKERALSVSHRDHGVNYQKDTGTDSELIKRRGVSDIDLWEMPRLSQLQAYDFCFHRVLRNRLVKDFDELQELLSCIHTEHEVVLVSILGVKEEVVRNWLCQLSALRIQNYLLVGRNDSLSTDLARRGHPVLVVNEFGFGSSYRIAVHAMQQITSLGYSLWYARPDLSWLIQPLVSRSSEEKDILAVEVKADRFHTGIFFMKSSSKTNHLLEELRSARSAQWKSFWSAAADMGLEIGRLEAGYVEGNATGILMIKEPEGLTERLKSASLWLVDDDLACKRVTCKART